MPITYTLSLKGYVGGASFDRDNVCRVLDKHKDQPVTVLIDSLGGSLGVGLSIQSAFADHGDVTVHFAGLNASAATIASLGAKHITIDAGAMYLVHQVSLTFFDWASRNATSLETFIQELQQTKTDLDKMDQNVAELYARKCKKPSAELLELMKVGGWLTAKEALAWGFVDEIVNGDKESKPRLTTAMASAMAAEGIPLPALPISDEERESAFARFLSTISSLFTKHTHTMPEPENKQQAAEQPTAQEQELTKQVQELTAQVEQHQATIAERDAAIAERDATIADLQAQLDAKPADVTEQVTENKSVKAEPANDLERFFDVHNRVAAMYK